MEMSKAAHDDAWAAFIVLSNGGCATRCVASRPVKALRLGVDLRLSGHRGAALKSAGCCLSAGYAPLPVIAFNENVPREIVAHCLLCCLHMLVALQISGVDVGVCGVLLYKQASRFHVVAHQH